MNCPLCKSISAESTPFGDHVLLTCAVCGTRRHAETPENLDEFYKKSYRYVHAIETDKATAALRVAEYKRRGLIGGRVLDVGAGNAAFLSVVLSEGYDAEGVEPCEVGAREFAYTGPRLRHGMLHEQAFPSESFDLITLHDVLEHIPQPVDVLRECARICRPTGAVVVELPDIEDEGGERHIRPGQHLFYAARSFGDWAKKFCDFAVVSERWTPIATKRVYVLRPVVRKNCTVLLPPGIGDVYWPVVKLRATAKALWGADHVDALIVDDGSNKNRSMEYLSRFPFVTVRGYLPKVASDPKWKPVWTDAYILDGKTRFTNVDGCDLFLAYNGVTRWGRSLEDVDLDASCEWFPPFHTTVAETVAVHGLQQKYGKWIVAYFVPWGMYRDWLKEMGPDVIAKTIRDCMAAVGADKALLPGASWDKDSPLAKELEKKLAGRLVNLSGMTDFDTASAMIRGSSGVVGFPCGLSMMGVQLRKPTVLIWNKYFVERFWWNAVAPASWGTWYHAVGTNGINPAVVASTFAKLSSRDYTSKPTEEMLKQKKSLEMQSAMMTMLSSRNVQFVSKARDSGSSRTSDQRALLPDVPAPPSTIVAGTSILFAAVLKTGGWCTIEHANTLFRAIKRNMPASVTCDFVLLTDAVGSTQASTVLLKHGWRGWWSKAELFRGDWRKGDVRPVVYLDLDTAIVGDLTSVLAPAVAAAEGGKFVMQEDFATLRNGHRKGRGSSALMVWSGDLTAPYEAVLRMTDDERDVDSKMWWLEQETIENACKAAGRPLVFLQDITPKNSLVSYKWQVCGKNGVPSEKLDPATKIVGFHGKPRPWDVTGVAWLEEALQ